MYLRRYQTSMILNYFLEIGFMKELYEKASWKSFMKELLERASWKSFMKYVLQGPKHASDKNLADLIQSRHHVHTSSCIPQFTFLYLGRTNVFTPKVTQTELNCSIMKQNNQIGNNDLKCDISTTYYYHSII